MTEADLIAAIESDPYDLETYRVYGDWLEANGDPRGALVGMQLVLERITEGVKRERMQLLIDEHMAAHRDVLGNWSKLHSAKLQWRAGFIHRARIDAAGKAMQTVLSHRSARFLTEIELWGPSASKTGFSALAELAPASLRVLGIDITSKRGFDLSGLWRGLSKLTRLELGGGKFELGVIDLPSLQSAKLSNQPLAAVAEARWPMLRTLELHLARDRDFLMDLLPVFARDDLPHLKRVKLSNVGFASELVRAIGTTPVWRQLEELDLKHTALDDEGAARWAAEPPPRRLPVLRIGASYLSHDGLQALRAVAEEVTRRTAEQDAEEQVR